MSRKFEYKKADGSWSKPRSLAVVMGLATTRVPVGKGPYTVTRDGVAVSSGSRKAALRRFKVLLRDAPADVDTRIRNDKKVFFAAKAVFVNVLDPKRAEFVKWARWGCDHEPQIHYSQARPIPQYKEAALPMTLDCSGSTITYARWSDVPDPSGGSYTDGNTDAILAHLPPISKSALRPGDLALWHNGVDGLHVAVVVETGVDPLYASHGSEGGPVLVRDSNYFHVGTKTYL
jgi:hypothetical protein